MKPKVSFLLLVDMLVVTDMSSAFLSCRTARQSQYDGISIRPSLSAFSKSRWDDLVDEDDEPNVPPDMRYIPRNVQSQNQNFVDIRNAGGPELTNDVYVREPGSAVFWFVGKVARVSDITLEQCMARQWPLIEQHAARLRPLELFPKRGVLEIWTAPGDSELDVAYNKPNIIFQKMEHFVEGAAPIKKVMVGFQGEMYDEGPQSGFRTWRTEDGRAAKPEIIPAGKEAPSQENIDRLIQTMDGMDINALYKEQQRREGRAVEDD